MATVGGVLGVIVLVITPALLAGRIAQRKGRPFWLYLLAGLVLGPLALIAAVALPRR